jgi:hypothetical protein
VSTWTKSMASSEVACAVRSARQLCPARSGQGSIPVERRTFQTVEAATRCASLASSPWILR